MAPHRPPAASHAQSPGSVAFAPSPLVGEGWGGGSSAGQAERLVAPPPRPSPTRGEGERSLVHTIPSQAPHVVRGTSARRVSRNGLVKSPPAVPRPYR